MKRLLRNIITIVVILHLGNSGLMAQDFEGELDFESHPASGKNFVSVLLLSNGLEKMSGMIGLLPVDFYFSADSLAMVFPNKGGGVILSRDSAKAFFKSTDADSLQTTTVTSKTKLIAGYHCTCIDIAFRSGKKSEYWFTTEFNKKICRLFARAHPSGSVIPDGSADFVKELNRQGKFVICVRNFGLDGEEKSVSTLTKVFKRPVTRDEIEIPRGTTVTPVTPGMLRQINEANAKKI